MISNLLNIDCIQGRAIFTTGRVRRLVYKRIYASLGFNELTLCILKHNYVFVSYLQFPTMKHHGLLRFILHDIKNIFCSASGITAAEGLARRQISGHQQQWYWQGLIEMVAQSVLRTTMRHHNNVMASLGLLRIPIPWKTFRCWYTMIKDTRTVWSAWY